MEYDACVNSDGSVLVGVPGKSSDGDYFGGYLNGGWFFNQQTSGACSDGICTLGLGAQQGDELQYFCQGSGCDSDFYYPNSNNQAGPAIALKGC